MDHMLRRPGEILAERPLRQVLRSKASALWTIRPTDSVMAAMGLMAEKNIGFLVVMDGSTMVGVLSERDCVRRVVLAGKSPDATPVAATMVSPVVTVDPEQTFADCLKLMHQNGIRHLPVVENGRVVTVVSIRDLLAEAVAHHAKVIAELERERLSMLTSMA